MNFKVNPNALIRVAGTNATSMKKLLNNDREWIYNVKKIIVWKKDLIREKEELISILFEEIKKETHYRNMYLNLKRDLYNHRYKRIIPNKIPSAMDERIKNRILNWVGNYQSYISSIDELKSILEKESLFLNGIYCNAWYESKSFQEGVKLASPALYQTLQKYMRKGRLSNNLHLSFLKYYTRATLKTSPLGQFCAIGIAEIQIEKARTKINYDQPNSFYINEKLRPLQEIAKRISGNDLEQSYHVNKNIWFENEKIYVLGREDDAFSVFMYRNGEKLVVLENSEGLRKMLNDLAEVGSFNYKYFSTYLGNYKEEIILNNFKQLIENHILIPVVLQEIEAKPLEIKQEYCSAIKYEDFLIEKPISLNLDQSIIDGLNLLHRLFFLLDPHELNQQFFAEYIYQNFGENEISFPQLLISFTEFEKCIKSDLNENNKIKFWHYIEKRMDQEIICLDELDWIKSDINTIFKPYSMTYYLQLDRTGKAYLNNVQSGYGRSFTRYNYYPTFKKAATHFVNIINKNIRTLEVINNRGYLANYHDPVTKSFIDYANVYNTKNAINLNDISFSYCKENKKIVVRQNGSKELIHLIHLHQASPSFGGKAFRLLATLQQSESVGLGVERFFNKFLEEPIFRIPSITIKGVVISREKWIINNQVVKSLGVLDEANFILQLYELHQEYELPSSFYVRRIQGDKAFNYTKLDDFYKPQFISLKNIHLISLYKKIMQQTGGNLLIEKCGPSLSGLPVVNGEPHAFELGVEVFGGT
ncbi:lantibiotic dehydratase [Sporosarcina sp. Marseille-Q4943]|uniref:lantibiotic dehydratase n=1 Tax=Sporosarcina sp. Marseille-Q4943 TaxID=2942204 RepID=UPI00208DCAA8|nr:lantibiotic dehydratase [Sporosarcina sp. Marseille-Q4943]